VRISDPVIKFPGIGDKYAKLLVGLGILTIKDLLEHYPVYYNDATSFAKISELTSLEKKTILVQLESIYNIRIRGGKNLQKAVFSDATGTIEAVWFNQSYLAKALKQGSSYLISGKLNPKVKKAQIQGPDYEIMDEEDKQAIHLGRIVPVYHLTAGISQKWLRSRIFNLVSASDMISGTEDKLPRLITNKYSLIPLPESYKLIHFPQSRNDILTSRKRLAFDELLNIQYKLYISRQHRAESIAPEVKTNRRLLQDSIESLQFKLTPSQQIALKEITSDLSRRHPMRRMIQGDVGSGKTVVAALASLPVIEAGYQVAVMAPTSILAYQLYENFRKFLPQKTTIELITAQNKKQSRGGREADVLVGTQALLFTKKKLNRPGLIIVDEQHRFGVNQRQQLLKLNEANKAPHMLHMTATPIPRTIALTLFGDLDVSRIERPAGRIYPGTFVVPEKKRESSYNWIHETVISGGQIFWVFPLIEDNPEQQLKSAKAAFKDIQKKFPDLKVGLLHGKLSEAEKNKLLQDFRNKKITILVSTTVVEVGIDIPDANVMIIEAAERFGLAQLHQLRGRIGRRGQQSWCLLFTTDENKDNVMSRLNFFSQNKDGIKIAEFDLKLRGPGEVYGTMQSGLPGLKIANFSNIRLLLDSQEAADFILESKDHEYFTGIDSGDYTGNY